MKRKVLSAFLLAGALVVTPIGGGLVSTVASASDNTTTTTTTNTNTSTTTTTNTASGNNTTTTTPSTGTTVTVSGDLDDIIAAATSGSTVNVTGVVSISKDTMTALLKKNATFVLKYSYNGVDYVVTIPAGTKLTDAEKDIKVFGPLYLAARFGTGATTVEGGYTVKAGDTMSRIARDNNMTLAELSALNPQVTNVNRISVGQKINLKK